MTDTTHAVPRPHAAGAGHPTRDDVLRECIAAEALWAEKPGRNLVLLFDGTGNILGNDQDTNVVKLLRMLHKGPDPGGRGPEQLVYYDPGVGTDNVFPPASALGRLSERIDRLTGLALGSGVFPNIAGAYEFLVRTYREGDRIYLLGFSRGAFTARAVAGMLNMYGLIHPEGLPLLDNMVRIYFAPPRRDNPSGTRQREDFARDVVENFARGRTPLVHFAGVWDTVESIGGPLIGLKISNSADFANKRFVHVRHAMSLHESRQPYTPRRYEDPHFSARELPHRSFAQRWFRGVHSDVGGSYARDGLSRITLRWMADEAFAQGLRMDRSQLLPGDPHTAMHDQAYDCPYWAWGGLNARQREPGDVVDASAMPVAAAVPAQHVQRTQPWRTIGWVLPVAVAALWAARGEARAFDIAFAIACVAWVAYPVAWALRRLVAQAVPRGRPLGWLPRHAHWAMRLFAAGELALLCIPAAAWPNAATALLGIRLLCLALLAAVLLLGALADAPGSGGPSGPGTGGLH